MAQPSRNASRAADQRRRHGADPATVGIVAGALRPRSDLLRSTALQAVFLAALAIPAARPSAQPAATALPTGGQVIAGQAKITTATGAAAMTVKQATPYGAYDWKSFDIGKSASVTYQVPTSQSVSVNRVISSTSPSVIAGKLTSNGVLVVQNQSGVVFTQGAEVNVNTLIASAPGISDANARAGRLVFDQPARPGAKVENHGTITVAQTGLAALVAPQVANSGVIRAQMGRVVLAGAEAHTVDLYGDGLLSIDVTRQVTKIAAGTDGKAATALVTNTGTIVADGGTILLTASAVDGLVQTLVTSGGTLRADTAGTKPGQVAIKAKGGNAVVAGTISARGTAPGSKGGQVEINAPSRTVTLKPTARIDVSGKAGGGTAAIGTTLARAKAGPGLKAPTARDVIIESGARVAADATLNGSGGNITILSQGGTTRHTGALSARGGPRGGNGGFIEVSGDTLVLGGLADVRAPAGSTGAILLDPIDLVITSTDTTKGADAPTKTADSITTKAGDGTTELNASDILLLAGNITIEALGTLTINAAVDTSKTATIGDVTFKSGKSLSVNAPVTVADTKTLALTSGGTVTLAADMTAGTIDLSTTTGGVLQTKGALTAKALLSTGGISGTLSLNQPANSLASIAKITVTGGDLLLANQVALDIAAAVTLDAGRIASLAVPGLTATAGSLTAGTVEIAPLAGPMGLGAAAKSELALTQATLDKISAATLQLGATSDGKGAATAITLNDPLDTSAAATTRLVAGADGIALNKGTLKAATLDVRTAGTGISEAGGTLAASTLQSTGGITGAVALGTADHAVAALGEFSTSGGLALRSTVELNVTGTVVLAGDSTLSSTAASAKAIEVTGSLALKSPATSLTLSAPATGGITLAGTVDTTATGTLNLVAGSLGVTQSGGLVTTGTLASTGGVAGTVSLAQSANAIASLGDLAVSTGNLVVASGTVVSIAGIVSADNVTITSSAASTTAISVPGSLSAKGAAGSVILSATDALKGGIALSGTVFGKASIDLSAGAGGILQSKGSLTTPTLASTGGIGATASLLSPDNAIGVAGAIKVTAGDLLLATKTTLDVAGTLAVDAGRTVALLPLGLKISTGAIAASGGTVEIAPIDGATMSLGKAAAAELTLTNAELVKISSATLRLGSTTGNATVADSLVVRDAFDATTAATAILRLDAGASGLTVDSAAVLKANVLDLNAAANGVTGVAGASITAPRLQSSAGITGDVALANSVHSIGTLGDMKVGGVLALATGLALDISGKVATKGASIDSADATAKAVAVSGQLTGEAGTTLALKASAAAGGIAITGTIDASSPGTLDLVAGTGAIAQSGGTIVAGTLVGSSATSLILAANTNQFGTLGAITAGSSIDIRSAIATTIAGPVSAANVTLASGAAGAKALDVTGTIKATGTAFLAAEDNAGGIALSGTLEAAVIDLNAGTGGIVQSGGALTTSLVQSSGDSGGSVLLAAPGNAIAALGSFVVSGASELSVASSTALKVTGPVKSDTGNITLATTAAGTLDIAGTVATSKATIALRASNAAGAIRLGADVSTAGGTIDLVAGSGGVAQTAGSLTAQRLISATGIGGKVDLASATNALLGIGTLAVTAGDMALVNAGPLEVSGTLAVSAGSLVLDVTDPTSGGLTVPGTITGKDVTLIGRGAAGAINIAGSVAATGTLDLSVTGAGGITAPGTLSAGTLLSGLGSAGAFTATGPANSFATVGGIAAKGGDIALATKDGTGFSLAGTLAVDAGKSVTLQVDSLAIPTGKITAPSGTVEIRAATVGLGLGAAAPGELALLNSDLTSIATDTLLLASSKAGITLRADLDTAGAAPTRLRLDGATGISLAAGTLTGTTVEIATAAGDVTQPAGLLSAKVLTTGIATVAGQVTLDNPVNAIAQVGPLKATGTVSIASASQLIIADAIKAPGIALTSAAAGPALTLSAPGALQLSSPGTITLATTNAAGTSTLSSNIVAFLGGTLLLSGNGAINQTAGQIIAGTVATTGTIGSASLTQPANAVTTLGAIAAKGDVSLTTTQPLAAAGTVSAANLTLSSNAAAPNAIAVSSADFGTAAGGTITLSAGNAAGGIALSGALSASASGILDLSAGTAGITQTAGSLTAATLRSTGGIGGAVALPQPNSITELGPLAAKGAITLVSDKSIAIAAPVSAGAGTTLSLAAPGMTFAGIGALTATGGVVEIGPTSGTASIGLGTAIGDFTLGSLANVTANLVRIGQASAAGNANKAAGITLADAVTPAATTLELVSSGAITQTKGGLVVPVLTATAAALDLSQPGNSITTLGALTITGDLLIATDGAIAIPGTLSAANISLRSAAAAANALDIGGTLSTAAGGTITLSATGATGGIALSGKLDATATGTIDLASGTGGIIQTAGTLTAGTLRSSGGSTGSVSLDQAGNAIGTLGDLSAAATLTLRTSIALDVTGSVTATDIALRTNGATLSLAASGNLASTGTMLLAATSATGGITLAGTAKADTFDLSAGKAGITQTGGTLTGGTLRSTGGSAGTVSLTEAGNSIATLGPFAVSAGDLSLAGASALAVAGPVTAANVTLNSSAASTKAIDITGTVSAASGGTVTLAATDAAGGIALSGSLSAPAGTIDLSAGSGGIQQSAGSLVTGTLRSSTGSAGAVVLAQPANQIAVLGDFAAAGAGFSLTSSKALAIPGSVNAAAITVEGSAAGTAISLTGALSAPGGALALTASNATGGLSLGGTLAASKLDLVSGAGGIIQPAGSLAATTLSTKVTGSSASLDRPGNSIATLGDSTVTGGSLTLADSTPLTVAGAVKADAITLTGAAPGTAITVTGSLASAPGGKIALAASDATGAIALSGTVNASASGVLDLSAGAGISQSAGSIVAGTLQSAGKVGADLTLTSATNAIGGIAALAVGGTASITDSIGLDIAGPLSAATLSVTGTAPGTAISISGSASSSGTMTLAATNPAGGIALSGVVSAALLDLSAGTGGISQTGGTVTATTLRSTAGASGTVSLDQAGNAIATLADFAVSGAGLTLRSSVPLDVAGTLSADAITLRSAAASPSALSVTGTLSTGGTALLAATGKTGGISLTGAVKANTLDLTAGTAGVAQGAGSITAATLQSTGGSAGSVSLGQAANSIATVGDFAVAGGTFTLVDAAALSVAGTLKADGIALTAAAAGFAIAVPGTIAVTPGGTIALVAKNATGGIDLSGTVNATATGTIDLSAGSSGISQSAGSITAGLVRSTSGVSGPVALTQSGNAIGTLGDFNVTGSIFALADSIPLTIAGNVAATGIGIDGAAKGAAISLTGSLSAPGGTVALSATHATGGLSLGGTIAAGTLNLAAGSAGITQPGGSITATLLRASAGAGGVALDQAANAIGQLGDTKVTGGALVLVDSAPLTVSGAVQASNVALTGSAAGTAITVTGNIETTAGGTITLAATNPAGGIDLGGTLNATATGVLDISAGASVTQSGGAITTGTLRSASGIGGSLSLLQAGNAIGRIGTLAVMGDVAIADSIALDIAGALSATNISIGNSAAGTDAIQVTGSAQAASAMALLTNGNFGNIDLSGTLKAAALDLSTGPSGRILQTGGSITAGTLSSVGGFGSTMNLVSSGNAISALGAINAPTSSVDLNNSVPLNVAGPVSISLLSLTSSAKNPAAIAFTGKVEAGGVQLAATDSAGGLRLSSDLSISGTMTATAGSGGLVQSGGSLVLGSLDATVTGGNITLNEAGNRIANLGLVSVTGGDLSVTSFTGFDVSGVTAGNVTLRSLSSVIATKLSGVASNANGTITLAAETGIGLSGPLAAGTGIVDLTVGKGGVTQDAGGPITAGTLRSTGGVSGSVQLDKAANGIATIADFAAGGTFALNNAVALKVGGTLAAADIAIVGGAASANAIDIAGTARSAAGGSIALVATSGGIALSGIVDASTIGVLDLSAAGPGVAQSGGTIVAGTLRSSNGLGGSVILDQPGNAIGTLGPITVSAGSLAVTSAIPLTSVGPVSVGAGNLALTGTSAGTALSITGPVTVSGTARLAATDSAGGIALGAALQAGVLELSAGTGGVVQSGGALALGSLQSSGLSGSVTLPQPGNTIASIGTFVLNSGDATIVSSAPITVAGTLNALQGDISVTGLAAGPTSVNVAGKVASGPGKTTTLAAAIGGITITGSAAAPGGQLVLPTATGVVAPGVLAADRLAVSATKSGDVALAGLNAIGTLAGAILANGNFLLNNAAPLTISGPLTARTLGITAADSLRVSDGVSIVTDGLPRIDQGVSNTLTDPQIAKLTTTGLGSHLAVTSSFGAPAKIDVGKINVMPFSAQMATLDLVLPHPAAGTISIGQLTGKSTDLILVTRAGGIATGTIDVAGLLVVGNGGKADLFGKIGGVDGQAAANRANISPQPSSDYRFNACPITSVNCVLIPIQTVPPISPLRDVPIIRDRPTQDDTDVQLPNVSEEDY